MRTPEMIDLHQHAINIRRGYIPPAEWPPWSAQTLEAYLAMRQVMETKCRRLHRLFTVAATAAAVFFLLALSSFLPFWRNPCPF